MMRASLEPTAPAPGLLTDLLRDVSRSFYLTVRILPRKIRSQIGLAYLLARITDTIADTEIIPIWRRLEALEAYRDRISGINTSPLEFGELITPQASAAERVLLKRGGEALEALRLFDLEDQELIQAVLETITSGQELDLRRFAEARPGNVIALKSDAELEDYTCRVAGCVGEFWTRICQRRLGLGSKMSPDEFIRNGIRFGQGLQWVNILRDLAADLRQGRCYIPKERLDQIGLAPEDLLREENESALRPLYNEYLGVAEEHLRAGWEYANALPWSQMRLRLACAWPVLIGVQTLARLRGRAVLSPREKIKVSRKQVRKLLAVSILYYPWPRGWGGLWNWAGGDSRESRKAIASERLSK
jgi:farnesyl-diphosphate farnesyltransferase